MKARFAFALFLAGVCSLSGCYRHAHLYPVQGPLASQTPPPIFTAKITGAFVSGSIFVTLANGEVFSGPWRAISVKERARSAAAAKPAVSLASAWDTVYGQGFYTAHVLGARFFAQSTLTGNQGTTVQAEMYRQDHGGDPATAISIKGVVQDSKGNIYKLVL